MVIGRRYKMVNLQLENITDTRYTINRGYTMPGITAMGGFRLTFIVCRWQRGGKFF